MVRVVSVPDGGTLVLANGDKVRLAGIQAPKPPVTGDQAQWAPAEDARAFLTELAEGESVELAVGETAQDRHGRLLGQVYLSDGTWVQGAMVQAGMARVYTFPDTRECAADLYALERQARVDRLGLWAEPYYALADAARPDALIDAAGTMALVEGRVLNAAKSGQTVYLNFGRRWKDDFTVVMDTAAQKLFARAEIDPLGLQDAVVRVRGWLEVHDGPRIAVTHPEQIEVVAWP